ncbi:MAG: hypothetical protein HQK63_08340 [Desulfamplus sp.]|nr:hypothetical protein [Desulfamplus sp.]
MNTILQKKVFSSLQISQEQILDEIAILMVYQKRSEFIAEVDWYKQKYKMDFPLLIINSGSNQHQKSLKMTGWLGGLQRRGFNIGRTLLTNVSYAGIMPRITRIPILFHSINILEKMKRLKTEKL